jgi:hypothetical protein
LQLPLPPSMAGFVVINAGMGNRVTEAQLEPDEATAVSNGGCAICARRSRRRMALADLIATTKAWLSSRRICRAR